MKSSRKSTLNIHWKDWCWSSNTLATCCQEPTHWKISWFWERSRPREGGNRGWDGWMASLTQLTCCLVVQLCPTLSEPMDCSMPGFPVLYHLPELVQTHVHQVGDAIQSFILCYSLLLLPSIFPSIRVISNGQFFTPGGQSIGVSSSASVLPMNIQDWSPLGWTGWISL